MKSANVVQEDQQRGKLEVQQLEILWQFHIPISSGVMKLRY